MPKVQGGIPPANLSGKRTEKVTGAAVRLRRIFFRAAGWPLLFFGEEIIMLLEIVQTINSYLSDYILVFLLVGVGL